MSDRNDARSAHESDVDDQLVKAAWAYDERLSVYRRDEDAVWAEDVPAGVETLSRLLQAQRTIELLFHAGRDAAEASLAGEATADSPSRGQEETLPVRDATKHAPLETPATFGRFEVRRELGRGGLGVVLLARDPILNRDVAVKIPRPEALLTPELQTRFLREAQAAARLTHPNIVAVYEAGQVGVVSYIAAAYCQGSNLADWIKGRGCTIAPRQSVEIVLPIADAIEYAHAHGVLHRDLKPSNILLEPFESAIAANDFDNVGLVPKVSDFGLAKIQDLISDETRTGLVMGTPAYMAPEQAEGRLSDIGPATDVYGLGTILYELLTGQPAFRGGNDVDTLRKVVSEEPVAPRALRSGIARDLEAVCLKCLHKEPSSRYPTAGRLAADLRRVLRGHVTEARPRTLPERVWKWARRRPAIAAMLLVSIVSGITIAALSGLYSWRMATALALSEQRRVDAMSARTEADAHRQIAEHERDANEQYAYAGRMEEAFQTLRQGSIKKAAELLDKYASGSRLADMRGFEWHYLHRALHDERLVLRGHRGEVYGVAFSPDGGTLVSGGEDGTIRIWDPRSGEQRHVIHAHESCTNDVDFSPDGKVLASASCDGTIKLWDTSSWTLLRVVTEQSKPQLCAAFSPDGHLLAGEGADKGLSIWDLQGTLLTILDVENPLNVVSWSHDSRYLLVPFVHGYTIFNTSDWSRRDVDVKGPIMSVAFSPTGDQLGFSSNYAVGMASFAATSPGPIVDGHRARIDKVLFRPNGRELLSCGADYTVKVWKVPEAPIPSASAMQPALVESRTLLGHTGRVQDMIIAPDGCTLATASYDGTVRLWDLDAPGASVPMLRCPVAIQSDYRFAQPELSSDLSRLAVHTDDGRMHIWDVTQQQLVLDRDIEAEAASAMAFGHDLQRFVGWDWVRGRVIFSDVASAEGLITATVPRGPIHSTCFSRDGTRAVAVEWTGHARVWDTTTGELHCTFGRPGEGKIEESYYADHLRPALSDDGRRLAICNVENAGILDVDSGSWTDIKSIEGACSDVQFSPDGRYLLINGYPSGVNLIDAHTGELSRVLRLQSPVTALTASRDGKTIATAVGRRVHLWHSETGQRIGTLAIDEDAGSTLRLQFSEDGRHLGAVTTKVLEDGTGLATLYVW